MSVLTDRLHFKNVWRLSFLINLFKKFRKIMPKSHACEKKSSKCTTELDFCKNCKLVRCSRKIILLKMENHACQSIVDQPL